MDTLPYSAILRTRATLGLSVDRRKRPYVTLSWGREPLRVNTFRRIYKQLVGGQHGGETTLVALYPRTDKEGTLSTFSTLKGPLDGDHAEEFTIVGQLGGVNRAAANFTVVVRPNQEATELKEAFTLTLHGSLDLLTTLPSPGAGVEAKGKLRPLSLRLMTTEVREVALLPSHLPDS